MTASESVASADVAARLLVRSLPIWRRNVELEPLPGGLSNRNFLVKDGPDHYVARVVGGDIPEHGIVRANEIAVSRAAHRAGVAPELVFADRDILVLRFIAGRTLVPEDVREPEMLDRVAALLRRCHREIGKHLRGPTPCFWVFHTIRDYLAQLEAGWRLEGEIERLRRIAETLERRVGPIAPTVTHNDLMPGNLIDDGARLWLIDWEYGGYGAPLFDLATLVVNNDLDAAAQSHVLASYLGAAPDAELRDRLAATVLAARLRESLWARVQESHGQVAFDYRGYADEHAAKFERDLDLWAATARTDVADGLPT
jgi:thiamine kinase-like enzyme